jgi:hypothetical protein
VKFLKTTLATDTVPIEIKLECAKELSAVLRKLEFLKDRQRSREAKLQLAELEHNPQGTAKRKDAKPAESKTGTGEVQKKSGTNTFDVVEYAREVYPVIMAKIQAQKQAEE